MESRSAKSREKIDGNFKNSTASASRRRYNNLRVRSATVLNRRRAQHLPFSRFDPIVSIELASFRVDVAPAVATWCAGWPALGHRAEDFPRTNGIISRSLALPIGVLFTAEDADYVVACIRYLQNKISDSVA